MACSKLFSGDLPELINEIIHYFHFDYNTLHSCILVNRLWCRLAIPLLWEDPFLMKIPKNHHFIGIYLYNLNDDYKKKLNEYGINDLFPSNTLFNYPSFIQCLNTNKLSNSVEKWIATLTTKLQHSNYLNSSPLQTSNFTKLIYKSLFSIFIGNEVNLQSFEVIMSTDEDYENFYDVFELILQKPNFIGSIKNLSLDIYRTTNNITKFLIFLYSNCNSISSLYFLFPYEYNQDNHIITEKNLSQIINSQENLRKITLGFNEYPLRHLLLSLKNTNGLNTLNTIVFYCIDFRNIDVLNEVFNQLNVLESIHIIHCYSLDSKFIQQIISITKPFKLKSLLLEDMLQIESPEPLIQKFGDYLENFEVISNGSELSQLLESVIKYCSNIKYLHLVVDPDHQNIKLILDLIEKIKLSLSYLSIEVTCYYIFTGGIENHVKFSSIVLQNLGQILPFKLEYLNLSFTVNGNDLEVFLKNSQNTFIKKLLIRDKKRNENEDIYPYVKEYIMKKKRVKYLAISRTFYGKSEDLFFLKDIVKEFELHDIQVLNYNDLCINTDYFLKEIS
jgi:hypothetical protein